MVQLKLKLDLNRPAPKSLYEAIEQGLADASTDSSVPAAAYVFASIKDFLAQRFCVAQLAPASLWYSLMRDCPTLQITLAKKTNETKKENL